MLLVGIVAVVHILRPLILTAFILRLRIINYARAHLLRSNTLAYLGSWVVGGALVEIIKHILRPLAPFTLLVLLINSLEVHVLEEVLILVHLKVSLSRILVVHDILN